MGGVDAFGQLASTCRLLRRSKKSWKCMFYDLVEVAAINSYLLMQECRQEFPDSMPQPTSYSQSEYRANRASQFAGKAAGEPLPLKVRGRKQRHQETKRMVGGGGGGLTSCSRYKAQLLFCHVGTKSSIACTVCKNRNENAEYFRLQPDRQCFQDFHQR